MPREEQEHSAWIIREEQPVSRFTGLQARRCFCGWEARAPRIKRGQQARWGSKVTFWACGWDGASPLFLQVGHRHECSP